MKIKLSDIVNSVTALSKLGEEKLPIKLSYSIQRNIRLLQPELKSFEDARLNLIKDCGIKLPDENWQVQPDHMKEFIEKIEELVSVEIELDIHKISMNENINISANDLLLLSWMFDNE